MRKEVQPFKIEFQAVYPFEKIAVLLSEAKYL